ncbi:hypothetical protein I552_5723 [Mycobacterium xenopi 3993]|nr:hypothetical protein I552_5723 [Mycobacterium xenopi 3993]
MAMHVDVDPDWESTDEQPAASTAASDSGAGPWASPGRCAKNVTRPRRPG